MEVPIDTEGSSSDAKSTSGDTTTFDWLHLLASSTQTMWEHCAPLYPDKSAQRRKFMSMLDWFARKHGLTVKRRFPATYRGRDGSLVRGNVDALVQGRTFSIAVDLDFSPDETSAYKLLDVRKNHGARCLLVCAYGDSYQQVRARVDEGFRKPTVSWLCISHLKQHL